MNSHDILIRNCDHIFVWSTIGRVDEWLRVEDLVDVECLFPGNCERAPNQSRIHIMIR